MGWFTGRAALYGLLEANMGWGILRYMRCISPLFIPILFMTAVIACAFLQRRFRKFLA